MRDLSACASASEPLPARRTSYPTKARHIASMSWIAGSSSTTSSRVPGTTESGVIAAMQ